MLRRELLQAVFGLGLSAGARGPAASAPAPLQAGVAKIDITPPGPVALDGYLNPENRVSEGVHDRIYARAIALVRGGRRVVLVACDLTTFPLASFFERAIADRTGLKPDELMLCAIHTHSGPLVTLNTRFPANVEYTQSLVGLLGSAVGRALHAVGPVRLSVGRGRSPVGVSRRKPMPGGGMEMAPNPEGAVDHEVLVLLLSRPGSQPFAALFDYACHSRSLGPPNRLLSGDVLGLAEQEVEKAMPRLALAAAVAGASADVDPVSVVNGFESVDGKPPETVRLATLLGQDVLRAVEGARPLPSPASLRTARARVGLPPKWAGTTRSVTVSVAAAGPLALVGLDCEAAVEIGLAIKAGSPFPATFVISHCNGGSGYLPVARQHAEGGYEVARTGFGPPAADLLVKETLAMLAKLGDPGQEVRTSDARLSRGQA